MSKTFCLAAGLFALPLFLSGPAFAASDAKGYLDTATLQALAAQVPAPPAVGSDEERADKARSEALRSYENTDRWMLATSHAEVRPPHVLQHFDCSLNLRFTPDTVARTAPATLRIVTRLFEDAEAASSLVKNRAFRARPVGDDASRLACQRVSDAGRASASYPSGSATVATALGEAMASLSPADAEAARKTGDEIAISRAVCAMHYPQDVRTGMMLGRAVFEAAQQSPAFREDLELARAEITRLKASSLTNPSCAAERLALSNGPAL